MRQSFKLGTSNSPYPKKARISKSKVKTMFIVYKSLVWSTNPEKKVYLREELLTPFSRKKFVRLALLLLFFLGYLCRMQGIKLNEESMFMDYLLLFKYTLQIRILIYKHNSKIRTIETYLFCWPHSYILSHTFQTDYLSSFSEIFDTVLFGTSYKGEML